MVRAVVSMTDFTKRVTNTRQEVVACARLINCPFESCLFQYDVAKVEDEEEVRKLLQGHLEDHCVFPQMCFFAKCQEPTGTKFRAHVHKLTDGQAYRCPFCLTEVANSQCAISHHIGKKHRNGEFFCLRKSCHAKRYSEERARQHSDKPHQVDQ